MMIIYEVKRFNDWYKFFVKNNLVTNITERHETREKFYNSTKLSFLYLITPKHEQPSVITLQNCCTKF